MDIDKLRKFCAVVETMNMRKAAEVMGISHSGLSKAIKTLEDELNMQLITKSGRGIVITDQGLELYKRSDKFFDEVEILLGKKQSDKNKVLRLGSFEVFTTYFISNILRTSTFSDKLEVHELVPGHMEDALLNHEIDIAITYQPIPKKGLEYIYAGKLKKSIYGLKSLKKKGLNVSELPFAAPITPIKGIPGEEKGLDGWPEKSFPRDVKYHVDMMETGLQIASSGIAVIYLPDFIIRLRNKQVIEQHKLVEFNLPKGFRSSEKEIYLVKREASENSESIKLFLKALAKLK